MVQHKIQAKPLSVNECWQGRRFKTDKYKAYEKKLLYMLPATKLPKPPFAIHYEFGFSNKASDLDNPTKCLQDILCKKYGFDDKHIYRITIDKKIVKKGEEYLQFQINTYTE